MVKILSSGLMPVLDVSYYEVCLFDSSYQSDLSVLCTVIHSSASVALCGRLHQALSAWQIHNKPWHQGLALNLMSAVVTTCCAMQADQSNSHTMCTDPDTDPQYGLISLVYTLHATNVFAMCVSGNSVDFNITPGSSTWLLCLPFNWVVW